MSLKYNRDVRKSALHLIQLALSEDFDEAGDITSQSMIPESRQATVQIVARQSGVLAGLPVVQQVFSELDATITIQNQLDDGMSFSRGDVISELTGNLRSLLAGERTALNFLTHLCGVASITRQFVNAVNGKNSLILDTRKTMPGWRLLQKYAVAAGGGTNHRMGLYDGCLIKDNHLAAWQFASGTNSIADAVKQARSQIADGIPLVVEVDNVDQLLDALRAFPDIVLLDNFPVDLLETSVSLRNETSPHTLLEASGGVTLETVSTIAQTGVERISVGALTHSVIAVDLAFDWKQETA